MKKNKVQIPLIIAIVWSVIFAIAAGVSLFLLFTMKNFEGAEAIGILVLIPVMGITIIISAVSLIIAAVCYIIFGVNLHKERQRVKEEQEEQEVVDVTETK